MNQTLCFESQFTCNDDQEKSPAVARDTITIPQSYGDAPVFDQSSIEGFTRNDYYHNMVEQNIARVDNVTKFSYLFYHQKVVRFLFTVADLYKAPYEVKYKALAILNDFLTKHIDELQLATINAFVSQTSSQDETWRSIEARLINQMPLRTLSAVHIALKAASAPILIPNKAFVKLLHALGQMYTIEQTHRSERRMLNVLGFLVQPPTLVEALLNVLDLLYHVRQPYHRRDDTYEVSMLPRDSLWHASLLCLDHFTLNARVIGAKIFQIAMQPKTTKNDKTYLAPTRLHDALGHSIHLPNEHNQSLNHDDKLELFVARLLANHLLIASACISVGIFIVRGADVADMLCEHICSLTSQSCTECADLAATILQQVVDAGETELRYSRFN